jgi:hypothetical protein
MLEEIFEFVLFIADLFGDGDVSAMEDGTPTPPKP